MRYIDSCASAKHTIHLKINEQAALSTNFSTKPTTAEDSKFLLLMASR
jgi:hypothetical protein